MVLCDGGLVVVEKIFFEFGDEIWYWEKDLVVKLVEKFFKSVVEMKFRSLDLFD